MNALVISFDSNVPTVPLLDTYFFLFIAKTQKKCKILCTLGASVRDSVGLMKRPKDLVRSGQPLAEFPV